MRTYLRKSAKIGPLRINFSKNGIGWSIGVKGMRYGKSAKGKNYIAGGRNGIYYKKNISQSHNINTLESQETEDVPLPIGCYPFVGGIILVGLSPLIGLIANSFSAMKLSALIGGIIVGIWIIGCIIYIVCDDVNNRVKPKPLSKDDFEYYKSKLIRIEYNDTTREYFNKMNKDFFFKLKYEREGAKEYYFVPKKLWEEVRGTT